MASAEELDVMTKTLPCDYHDLETTVQKGPAESVNVMGVVVDYMQPVSTRGTDMQMTFTIRDLSPLSDGLRIKFFRPSTKLFPAIKQKGDIIVLRRLKIHQWGPQLVGLSNWNTQFIVFPQDEIIAPDFRIMYAVHNEYMKHAASPGAFSPTIHEQQWIITLNARFHSSETSQRATETKPPVQPVASTHKVAHPAPKPISQTVQTTSTRNKFSLIKDIDAGDRGGNNRSGNFYDLAGEVVKLFSDQMGQGVLDLYVTDYTSNEKLPIKTSSDLDLSGASKWRGPSGKMTLHIEVYPPHSVWAQHNVKEGDFVYLRNVRIKWNQRGLGSELEGNLWQDNKYPNKIDVTRLHSEHHVHSDLLARKARHAKAAEQEQTTGKSKKSKKNKNKKMKATKQANDVSSKPEDDSDAQEDAGAQQAASNATDSVLTARKKLNRNVQVDDPDVPFSSLDLILNNPSRLQTEAGEKRLYPFTNVKHHTKLRVVDFYPHVLDRFCVWDMDEAQPKKSIWQWRFWLVLTETTWKDDEPVILIEVFQTDAEYLLGMEAGNLQKDREKLKQLEETLFLLWGELGERKAKFLDSHPLIKPDVHFTCKEYNISAENLPFELCVAEYGKRTPARPNQGERKWYTAFKMFGTKIKR